MKKLHFFFIVFVVLIFAGNLSAQDIYLYYPGITEGKGTQALHPDEVRLSSISGGVHMEKVNASSYSATPQFSPYSLTKSYDGSSPLLMANLVSGRHTQKIEIRFYSPGQGGNETLALKIELRGAFVVSYEAAGAPCGDCPVLSETFSIDFDGLRMDGFSWDRN